MSNESSDLSDEEISDEELWLRPNPVLESAKVDAGRLTFATSSKSDGSTGRRAVENSEGADSAVRERWAGRAYRMLSVDIGVANLVLAVLDFERMSETVAVAKKRKRTGEDVSVDERYRRSPWGDFVVRSVEVLDVVAEKSEMEEDPKKSKELEGGVSLEVACRCVWDALESRRSKFAADLDRVVIELQPGGQETGVRNPAVAHFILAYFFRICGPDKVEFQSATRKLCVFFDATFDPHRLFNWLAERRAAKKRTAKKNHEADWVAVARGIKRDPTFADLFEPKETPNSTETGVVSASKKLSDNQVKEIVYNCNKAFSVHQVGEILSHHGRENLKVLKFVRELEKKDDATDAILQALYYYAELRRKAKQLPPGCEKDVLRKYRAANRPINLSGKATSKGSATVKKPPFKFARFRGKK